MIELARYIDDARKIVFTKTLEHADWKNTEIEHGNFVREIKNLKKQTGRDMIVYGGQSFVVSLIREKLIDEFHLFVNPVALGKGLAIFNGIREFQELKLKKTISYNSGIVLLNYELPGPASADKPG